jgi:hypothetical protein
MQRLTILIILVFYSALAYSTGQEGDIILWNNNKYFLHSNPLESYPQFDSMRSKLFGDQKSDWNTACYRGYVAEWEILSNRLYLTNIYACNDRSKKADLNRLFPGKIKDRRMEANWVTEILIIPNGKCLFYGNLGYVSIYEIEYELTINNGELREIKKYDNEAHISVFTEKPDSLMKFIDFNIKWELIPDSILMKKAVFTLSTTDNTKPEIKLIRSSGSKILDDEASRVLTLLPDWDFYVQRGKVFKRYWIIPIVFSHDKKIKYTH